MGKELFDYDWKFYKGGAIGAEAYNYDDASWRKLHLPHDWSIEDLGNSGSPFTETAVAQSWSGFTVGGTAWYRKTFNISPKDKGKKFFITFDGVYMNSSVWLNGKPLGGNAYGYTEFSLDISEVLNFDKPNIIAVKVSNEGETSRWYSGSGIYRHVWLETKNPIRLSRWGTFITKTAYYYA
jgi:beta-galactosidase